MASEEDRRLATILISLSDAFKKNTSILISKSDVTTGRTFGNDNSKNEDEDEDEGEDKSNKIEGDKLVGRWRVVSVEMEQRRVEMIEKEIQEGEDGDGESKEEMVEEEKQDKKKKKKKKKETKKNTNNEAVVEIPKTKQMCT